MEFICRIVYNFPMQCRQSQQKFSCHTVKSKRIYSVFQEMNGRVLLKFNDQGSAKVHCTSILRNLSFHVEQYCKELMQSSGVILSIQRSSRPGSRNKVKYNKFSCLHSVGYCTIFNQVFAQNRKLLCVMKLIACWQTKTEMKTFVDNYF